MICPNCGANNPAGSDICWYCKARLTDTEDAGKIVADQKGGDRQKNVDSNRRNIYYLLAFVGFILMLIGGTLVWSSTRTSEQIIFTGGFIKNTPNGILLGDRLFTVSSGGELFAIQYDKEMILFSARKMTEVCRFSLSGMPTSFLFTSDGAYLITSYDDGVWDVRSSSNCEQVYSVDGGYGRVSAVTISSDGRLMAMAATDGATMVWDLISGALNQSLPGNSLQVTQIAISPDGRYLAVCAGDGNIYIWDLVSGEIAQTFSFPGGEIKQAVFSPDSQQLAVVSSELIQVWQMISGELLHEFNPQSGYLGVATGGTQGSSQQIVYSPNGKYLLCGCNGMLLVWRLSDGAMTQFMNLDTDEINSISVTNHGLLIVERSGEVINLWTITLDKELSGEPIPYEPVRIGQNVPSSGGGDTEASAMKTEENETPSVGATLTQMPTATWTVQPSPTLFALVTPVDLIVNDMDGAELVLVPAGEFLMGSDPGSDPYFYGAEGPPHPVYLDDYWIYRTEVTNAQYAKCVEVKQCPRPTYNKSDTREEYFGNPQYGDFPVVYVTWKMASAYCRWAGGRLPTEAEWEKAARGTDGRIFAWGNNPPNPSLVNYRSRDTVEVGSFPAGASPYGAYDMSGNVIEWVFDYFLANYYQSSPYENPRGPASGGTRVYRSGSYHNTEDAIRVVMRGSRKESHSGPDIGFRCVVDRP